jgi:hypothetical protein
MARLYPALIAAALAAAPAAAVAQAAAQDQVVATAPSTSPPKAQPAAHVASVSDAAEQERIEDDGPLRDNRVHGEVGVGVGTNGYRQIGGVVTAPIGDIGQATIAVDSSQYSYRRR